MDFESIAGLFMSLLFVAYGGFSLLVLFNPKTRLWYLKRNERKKWRIMPVKKSLVQESRSLSEGVLLAGSIVVALIFLPMGFILLVIYIRQIMQSIFQ